MIIVVNVFMEHVKLKLQNTGKYGIAILYEPSLVNDRSSTGCACQCNSVVIGDLLFVKLVLKEVITQ